MDPISLLTQQVKGAHEVVQGTVADLTPEQAQWSPPGKALSAGPLFAHLAASEDLFLNMMTGRQPLAMGAFAGKTGTSEPPPMGSYEDWARRVKVDLPQLSEYVSAVFKNTEAYVASLKPEDLDRELDLTSAGMGKISLGAFHHDLGHPPFEPRRRDIVPEGAAGSERVSVLARWSADGGGVQARAYARRSQYAVKRASVRTARSTLGNNATFASTSRSRAAETVRHRASCA